MKLTSMLFAPLLILGLVGCGSSSGPGTLNGEQKKQAKYGDYLVTWVPFNMYSHSVPKHLTPLFFTFSWHDPSIASGMTEEGWKRLSELRKTTVEVAKHVFRGHYYDASGQLRVCKGECGKKLNLSIAERTEMAKRVLATDSACQWVGFDPNYHNLTAYNLGAEHATLHVAADCDG
jgi:hypothetical protein